MLSPVALGVYAAPLPPKSVPPLAALYHLHVFPVGFVNVGNVVATAVQFATIVTVPLSLKFLKYVFVVELPVHAVLGFAAVPVLALLPTVVLVHPENVCALLVALPIVTPVLFAFPVIVIVFVGLLIWTSTLYVPLVGLFVPPVPPFNVYPIVYVFAVHVGLYVPFPLIVYPVLQLVVYVHVPAVLAFKLQLPLLTLAQF